MNFRAYHMQTQTLISRWQRLFIEKAGENFITFLACHFASKGFDDEAFTLIKIDGLHE